MTSTGAAQQPSDRAGRAHGRAHGLAHGRELLFVGLPSLVLGLLAVWLAIKFVRPAPPTLIRLISGPVGSSLQRQAERYKAIIESHGVKLEIITSKGSEDNLQKLFDRSFQVDVGFVQSGLIDEDADHKGLVSLGSLFPQPLLIYHRLPEPSSIERLTQLAGRRLAIGPEGSGTRALAIKLLKLSGITGPPTVFVDLGGAEAAQALLAGQVDAAFLTSDTSSGEVYRRLREAPDVALMNFRQARGYARRERFLARLSLPEGGLDIAHDDPPRDYELIGPTVELIARPDLHPALSDMLINAARQIHSTPGVFRDAGQYPSASASDFPISEDAERYYRTGGKLLYKTLPFWLASLIDRLLVLVLPLLVVLVPALRILPGIYRWRVRSRIYRWYGALMSIERDLLAKPNPVDREQLLWRLDGIEASVNEVKTPLSFADQLYVLREHVSLVRRRLESGMQTGPRPPSSVEPAPV